MPFRPDAISTRAVRRMAELERHLFPAAWPIGPWRLSMSRPDDLPSRPADEALAAVSDDRLIPDQVVEGTVRLPADLFRAVWLSTTAVTPEALAGHEVWLRLDANAEALLYVNGQVWQGMDANRPDVLLAGSGVAGQPFRLDVLLWPGRDRAEKTLKGTLARFDRTLSSYRYDLQALAGAARTMDPASTTAIRLWRVLEASLDAIDFHGAYGRVAVEKAAALLHDGVTALGKAGHLPLEADLFCTGNSHIDVAWLWTLAETRQKMGRTTATALRYMEEFPGYHFAQSQAQLYAWLEIDFPELFDRVKERVRAGQWHIAGGCWVEPDCNVTGGESLVRQLLYGQGFWARHFDFQSRVMWLPDTFGYAWALPQILRKSGIETFVTQKLQWNDTNKMPHGLFEWEGVDGTRIPCIFPRTYTARALPEEMADWYRDYPSKHVAPAILYPYGFGDGGGGPVREDFEMIARLEAVPGFPRCHHVPLDEGVSSVLETARRWQAEYRHELPVWKNELYLEFHRGTLTTNAATKRANRRMELLLREAEIWSVLAARRNGVAYPAAGLERAWKGVLLNQFHDILPGTSIRPVYEDAHRLYAEIEREVQAIAEAACATLVDGTEAAGEFSLFNSAPWPACEWVEVDLPDEVPVGLVDRQGRRVPVQVVATGETGTRVGFEATVPAFGAASFRAAEAPTVPSGLPRLDGLRLENDFFSVVLHEDGSLASVYDKRTDREWLDGPGNVFQTFEDRPNSWEAWDINDWYEQKPLDLLRLDAIEAVDDGPVRAGFRLTWSSDAGTRVDQRIVVYRTIPRIDFLTEVDWREQRVLWKVAFPVRVHRSFATYDIQFGAIERPTGRSTSWEEGRFEVCAHRWTDLSEANGGVSLLNDCKYGHDIRDNVMRISLLRSPTHPDPREPHPPFRFLDDPNVFSDQGRHVFRYSLYPHAGDWRSGTVRQALGFNHPLRLVKGRAVEGTPLEVAPDGVVVDTLKRAEDGRGTILRVYEAHGGRYPVTVRLPFQPAAVAPVDLMERVWDGDGPVTLDGSELHFSIRPYEIRTFRLL